MSSSIFPKIILNARPAAGKSEIIRFMMSTPLEKRISDLHIGKLHFIDDFPYLWRWFEEDDILISMGRPRIYTDSEGYFLERYFWDLLIRMMNLEYSKFVRDHDDYEDYTILFEFSRGLQHGGYEQAYQALSNQVLTNSAIVYINVPWEESLRKNRARFNPEKPDSILEHGLPDKKLEFLYHADDFLKFAESFGENGTLPIKNIRVPYAIFENEDDVTTNPNEILGCRLNETLSKLWKIYSRIY